MTEVAAVNPPPNEVYPRNAHSAGVKGESCGASHKSSICPLTTDTDTACMTPCSDYDIEYIWPVYF